MISSLHTTSSRTASSLHFWQAGVLALLLASALPAARARACSCMRQTPEDAQRGAALIFEGRVIDVEPASQPTESTTVQLEVVRVFKGTLGESLRVKTAADSAMCGYVFEAGQSYLVYADGSADDAQVSLCSRTTPMTSAGVNEDLKVLGMGATPFDPGAGSDQKQPPSEAPEAAPRKGGCASCAIGSARSMHESTKAGVLALAGLFVLGLRRASRRASAARA